MRLIQDYKNSFPSSLMPVQNKLECLSPTSSFLVTVLHWLERPEPTQCPHFTSKYQGSLKILPRRTYPAYHARGQVTEFAQKHATMLKASLISDILMSSSIIVDYQFGLGLQIQTLQLKQSECPSPTLLQNKQKHQSLAGFVQFKVNGLPCSTLLCLA